MRYPVKWGAQLARLRSCHSRMLLQLRKKENRQEEMVSG
jgi:hypothetical protein